MATDWSEQIAIADLADEPDLSEDLIQLVERVEASKAAAPHVVLNMGSVSYLNSSNIAQLLRLRAALASKGRVLKLCAVADEVWTVMLVAGLDKVFRFAPDTMTALAGLQLEESEGAG